MLDSVWPSGNELRADITVVIFVLLVEIREDIMLKVKGNDFLFEYVWIHFWKVLKILDHIDVRHLERILKVLFGRISCQHNIANLNELFGNFFAERVSVLGQEVLVIVQQYDHDLQNTLVERLHARRVHEFLVLLKELEKRQK